MTFFICHSLLHPWSWIYHCICSSGAYSLISFSLCLNSSVERDFILVSCFVEMETKPLYTNLPGKNLVGNSELPGGSGEHSKTPRPTPLKRWLNSPSKLQMLGAFVIAKRGWKANSHFLQNVWKRSSVSCAHLSPHTHTTYVERCGNINIQNSTCTEHRHYRHMQTRARTSWHLKGWEKMSFFWTSASFGCLVGLVRRPPWERKILGSNRACAGIFSGSSYTSDLKIGTPVTTMPGAWRYRVSAGTGRRRDFFGVELYQWLKNWHSSDYHARRLAL